MNAVPVLASNVLLSLVSGHHYIGSKSIYTEERLAKPIKHFVSYFVQELLIGVPSEVSAIPQRC